MPDDGSPGASTFASTKSLQHGKQLELDLPLLVCEQIATSRDSDGRAQGSVAWSFTGLQASSPTPSLINFTSSTTTTTSRPRAHNDQQYPSCHILKPCTSSMPPDDYDDIEDLRRKIGMSIASSYRFNSRNIEAPWYGVWTGELSRLVHDIPNFVVIPQYPLYFTVDDKGDGEKREKDQRPDSPDNIDVKDGVDDDCFVEDDEGKPPPASGPMPSTGAITDTTVVTEHPRLDNCNADPNASTSSAHTIAEPNAYTSIPDLCIAHVCTVRSKVKMKSDSGHWWTSGYPHVLSHYCGEQEGSNKGER